MFYVNKAFLFKFVFVNLPHCDGQKRVNTAESHDNLYMTVSRQFSTNRKLVVEFFSWILAPKIACRLYTGAAYPRGFTVISGNLPITKEGTSFLLFLLRMNPCFAIDYLIDYLFPFYFFQLKMLVIGVSKIYTIF